MPTREEFMVLLGENLSEEECVRLFGYHKDDLLDANVKWDYNLETEYGIFCQEMEYTEEVLNK